MKSSLMPNEPRGQGIGDGGGEGWPAKTVLGLCCLSHRGECRRVEKRHSTERRPILGEKFQLETTRTCAAVFVVVGAGGRPGVCGMFGCAHLSDSFRPSRYGRWTRVCRIRFPQALRSIALGHHRDADPDSLAP